MKKLQSLGRTLTKSEQQKVLGGTITPTETCDCNSIDDCSNDQHCYNTGCTPGEDKMAGKCGEKLS